MKFLSVIIFVCSFQFLSAQTTFNQIIGQVIENNPELKAARASLEAQAEQEKITLNLSDPEIEFSHKWGPKEAGNKTELGISQSFDWPGVYRHRRQSVRYKEEALRQLWQSNLVDQQLNIKLQLIDLVYVNKQRNLVTRQLNAVDSLLKKYSLPENRTSLTILDINKLSIERYRLGIKLSGLDVQKKNIMQALKTLNGNTSCVLAENLDMFPKETILPAAEYEQLFESGTPDILASEAESKSIMSQIKAEKSMRMPGFSVGYSFAREDRTSFNGFSLGISLPVFSTRHKLKAANLLKEAQEITALQTRIDAVSQTFALLFEVEMLKKRSDEALQLISETNYERLLKMALDGGEISLVDYLIESTYYMQFEEEYLNVCYQYQCAAARLNKYNTITK